jgi:Tfp pilus assembly protein PilO
MPGDDKATKKQKSTSPTQALSEFQKEQKQDSERIGWGKVLDLYVVPIALIAIFGGIIFLLIVPAVSNVFFQLGEIQTLNTETTEKDAQIARLRELSSRSSQITNDLAAIETIVPEGVTEVVNFQEALRALAERTHGLTVVEASTGERVLKSSTNGADSEENLRILALIEIPSTFAISGNLDQIKAFVADIKNLSDFVIIGEMELRTDQEFQANQLEAIASGEWRLTITLVKYQFQVPDEQNQLQAVYSQVPETIQLSADVLEYVRLKAAL